MWLNLNLELRVTFAQSSKTSKTSKATLGANAKVQPLNLQQAIFNMIPSDDQKNLPEDENTPEKRAEKVWEFFGKKENGNC